jgi:3'-phosphoadenosine 5'-phosphosulfate sulfotransferase (PAPS reductase)/FAD synthetase
MKIKRYDEKLFLMNSKLNRFKRLVEKAKGIVHKMFEVSNPYIAWSGGKDSTALVYLVTQDCGYKDTIVWTVFDDCDYPDLRQYMDMIVEKYNLVSMFYENEESVWDYLVKHKVDLRTEDVFQMSSYINKIFYEKYIYEFLNSHPGLSGLFMGLRTEESNARLWNFKTKSSLYYTNYDSMWHCNPLSEWKLEDVFTYLLINNVPVFPLYKKEPVWDLHDIRTDWWLPSGHAYEKQLFFLQKEYPELYKKFIRDFSFIRG